MSGQVAGTAPARRRVPEGRQAWLVLYVLCAGMLMIVLDSTIVNVALPSIRTDPELLAGTCHGWSTQT